MKGKEEKEMIAIMKLWKAAKDRVSDPEINQFLAGCDLDPEEMEGFKMFMIGLVSGAGMGDRFSIKED